MPAIVFMARVLQVPPSCWQTASGAMTRSTFCGLNGCAAGHKSTPSIVGAARAPEEVHDCTAGGGIDVPDRHSEDGMHTPEQSLEERPAREP